jgi:hypothetical protein
MASIRVKVEPATWRRYPVAQRADDERTTSGRARLDVDLTVVADHQTQGARSDLGARHHDVLADEAVLEAGDVADDAAAHDHRVLDLAVDDDAVVAHGGERADEAVLDHGAGADDERTAQRGVGDGGAGLDDDPAVEHARLVDGAVDARLDLLEQQTVGLEQRRELAGIDPPAGELLLADPLALVDEPLDGVGDLEFASR